ncbi:hypothetical protein BDB00DRAFT_382616 [Zychaea mexicana]|uniref:uncharacterized protein n=1 Tax=Zychaea mexicana TaxID=64656 RepID=UPI0022FEC83D|nr:uncharacterized protein BDB00DRAFT_382616 [Zychaea mexicana]KAI9493280.1 hypothetical protein BDB00DRAFT_382616 [Zychaea mexicana]
MFMVARVRLVGVSVSAVLLERDEANNTLTLILESYQGSNASTIERQHNQVYGGSYQVDSIALPPTGVLWRKRSIMSNRSAPEASSPPAIAKILK